MKTTLPLTLGLGAALLSPFVHAQEELAPPDVDFYAEAQMLRADLSPYGFDTTDGLDIRLGMWLNSVDMGGNSRLGLEAGFVRQSEDTITQISKRSPSGVSETSIPSIDAVEVLDEDSLRVNGFTLGTIWQTQRWVYLKAGAYFYDFKQENRHERHFLNNSGDEISSKVDLSNDSNSGIAPYATVGAAIPLLDNLSLTADYTQTQMESEHFGTFGIGLRFTN